jgi:hypothetical protein
VTGVAAGVELAIKPGHLSIVVLPIPVRYSGPGSAGTHQNGLLNENLREEAAARYKNHIPDRILRWPVLK